MSVTLNDVARAAGVSASTVSRVLSDSPRISAETKERVRKAIKELNYFPNSVARSLARNSTKTVGLILNTESQTLTRNPFFIQAMVGISIYAQANGYDVMFSCNKNEDEDLNTAMRFVSSRRVDGIILFTSRTDDKCIYYLKRQEFPFSVIGRPDDTDSVMWVDNDNFQATYQVTVYLITKGHSKISFIGGPPGHNVSKDRFDGYKRAMSVYGFSISDSIVFSNGDFSEEFGYECMRTMLSSPDFNINKPTAIVTSDDMQALGVIKVLNEKNIPDIVVTGFNNTPVGMYHSRMIASVDVNAKDLGYYAAKLLIDSIKGEKTGSHYIVPTELVKKA
jgi:DNA-binding LacI/PurR family transcriptional regulator